MFKQLFTTKFLFEINRIQIQPADKLFLALGAVALVLAAILKLAAHYSSNPVDAKFRNKLFGAFLFLGLSEMVWYGFRIQFIRFFGSHFVAILIGLIALVWFLIVLWQMFKGYKAEKTVWEKEQVRRKYLPK